MSSVRFSKSAVRAWAEREKAAANDAFREITGNHIDPRDGTSQTNPRRWAASKRVTLTDENVRDASFHYGQWHAARRLLEDLEDGHVVA